MKRNPISKADFFKVGAKHKIPAPALEELWKEWCKDPPVIKQSYFGVRTPERIAEATMAWYALYCVEKSTKAVRDGVWLCPGEK